MPYTPIQVIDFGNVASASSIVTGSYTLTAGSRVQFWAMYAGGSDLTTSCTDTNGNTWSKVSGSGYASAGGMYYVAWECKNVTAGGSTVITVALSSAASNRGVGGLETSGLDPTAAVQAYQANRQSAPGTGTDAITSANPTGMTPTSQPAMLLGFVQNESNGNTLSDGTGFTGYALPNCSVVNAGSLSRIQQSRLTSTSATASTMTTLGGGQTVVSLAMIVSEYVAPAALDPITVIFPLEDEE